MYKLFDSLLISQLVVCLCEKGRVDQRAKTSSLSTASPKVVLCGCWDKVVYSLELTVWVFNITIIVITASVCLFKAHKGRVNGCTCGCKQPQPADICYLL